jgi:hypothetical protein
MDRGSQLYAWVLVALAIGFILVVAEGCTRNPQQVGSLPEQAESADELMSKFQCGFSITNGVKTPIECLQAWVLVDATSIAGAAKTRLINALSCELVNNPTPIELMVCEAADQGILFKATATDEWLVYTLSERATFRKMKAQWTGGPFAKFAHDWDAVKAHARCTDFFTAPQCAAAEPPTVFGGHSAVVPTATPTP